MADVTIKNFVLARPLHCMQPWAASKITAEPRGSSCSSKSSAIDFVMRSWFCNSLSVHVQYSANLEIPTILPTGMYAMCAFP